MMHQTTTACFLLALVLGSSAQLFFGPYSNHPRHRQRAEEIQNMMLFGAMFGMEMNEPLMMQLLQQATGGPRPVNPRANRMNRRNLGNVLNMFGLIDGPDVPDPVGPGGGRAGRPGRRGGAGGGANKGGARAGGGPAPAAEEPAPRPQGRRRRRRQRGQGGA